MKKIVTIVALGTILGSTSAFAIEQCDAWFAKNDFGIAGTMGKSGAGVVLDKKGEISKIFASGSTRYDFDDVDEVSEALIESSMIAKANIAKFLKEEISSDESVDKISVKKKVLVKDGKDTNTNVVKKVVKSQTMSLRNNASALLTGIIKVCESNDKDTKEVQVVVAVSPNTISAASKASAMFNKGIGSRKTVEEYAAERKNAEAQDGSANTGATPPNTDSSKANNTQSTNESFSNKAKNMNF